MKPKDKLIEAATTLFSELGYDGTSVNDIAKRAGMNVSLISYHFGGKQGLLGAVMGKLAHEKLQAAERLLTKCETQTEFRIRLELFLSGLAMFFVEQPDLMKLFLYELEQGFDGAEKQFEVAYMGLLKRFIKYMEEAQKKNFIRDTKDIRTVTVYLLGPLTSLVRSRNSAAKYLGVTLEDQTFRDALIGDLVSGIIRSSK